MFFSIRISRVQTYITQNLTELFGEKLGAKIHIESARITFLNRFAFNNVLIEDQHHDTLIFVERLNVNYRLLSALKKKDPENRQLDIKKVILNKALVNFFTDSAEVINIKFFIDYLQESKDTSKNPLNIDIDDIYFKESVFKYHAFGTKTVDDKFNFSDLDFSDFNLKITDFNKSTDTVSFHIKELSFVDHSGFKLDKLESDLSLHKTFLHFNKSKIEFGESEFNNQRIHLDFPSFSSLGKGGLFYNALLNIKFDFSNLNLKDLRAFSPALEGLNNNIYFSTRATNTLSSLKLRDCTFEFGEESLLTGDFDFDGLPDFKSTFMFFDIKSLITTLSDISNINLKTGVLKIPTNLTPLGRIQYNGIFTGFVNDFVTYGEFHTNLGDLSTDILLRPDSLRNISYNGIIKAKNFLLGKLIPNSDDFGSTSFSGNIEGTNYKNGDISLNALGSVDFIEYKGYPVSNIEINGLLSNKQFNGSINVNDLNLKFNFDGEVDFSKDINRYEFNAQVEYANLYNLNIIKDDPDYTVSFLIEAKMSGNKLNNLNGDITLLNSFFTNSNNQIQIYDFNLHTYNTPDSNFIGVKSDLVDAEMYGNFMLDKFNSSFFKFINTYAPSLNGHLSDSVNFKGNFALTMKLKNTKPFFNFFLPQMDISENTKLNALYDGKGSYFKLVLQSNFFKYNTIEWSNFYVNTVANDSVLSFESGSNNLKLNDNISLNNFTFQSNVSNDSLYFTNRWHNWDTVVNKGNLTSLVKFFKSGNKKKTAYSIDILPSEIVVRDSLWVIDKSNIVVDSSYIYVNNLKIRHDDQLVLANGTINKKTTDSIVFQFSDYNLKSLNMLSQSNKAKFSGNLNGEAILTYKAGVPNFITSLQAENFTLNNENLGLAKVHSIWNEEDKSLNFDANIYKGKENTLNLFGKLLPYDGKRLTANIFINNFQLKTISNFIQPTFSNLSGLCSGNVSVKGTLNDPLINGKVKFDETSMVVNYLNTRYTFSDEAKINNNVIQFSKFKLHDDDGNSAMLNGEINTSGLRDFSLDLTLEPEQFMCLNTTSVQNSNYYGIAYTTGLVEISGPVNDLDFVVSARTEPGTKFFIPLQNSSEIKEYNFISFVNDKASNDKAKSRKVEVKRTNNLNLDFDLEVTPDAEVQIIFDSKIGDIIKSRGDGNISMEINTQGKFKMYGDYIISEEGDYLFTLQNIINRRFKVKKGGVITWDGDPSDAVLNLEAVYSTRTSISPLLRQFETPVATSTDAGNVDQVANTTTGSNRTTQVNCVIALSGKLSNPEIKPSFEFPNVDARTNADLEASLSSTEELNKQFLSFLAINSFIEETDAFAKVGSNTTLTTTTELLSNQLSHWLSQFSNQFDIGVNINRQDISGAGTDVSSLYSNEIGVNVSTQLWEDRVNINIGGNYNSTNDPLRESDKLAGDFEMDVKLNKSGKLRFKAFNHSEDDYIDQSYSNQSQQGVGFFYQEEFNSLGELFSNYWKRLSSDKNVGKKENENE